ncbi:MAG: hypothetical protein HC869_25275 [Rhodospirillales bacterium]|nr:hypothetical protein [Rhodospirillales bacterium]
MTGSILEKFGPNWGENGWVSSYYGGVSGFERDLNDVLSRGFDYGGFYAEARPLKDQILSDASGAEIIAMAREQIDFELSRAYMPSVSPHFGQDLNVGLAMSRLELGIANLSSSNSFTVQGALLGVSAGRNGRNEEEMEEMGSECISDDLRG